MTNLQFGILIILALTGIGIMIYAKDKVQAIFQGFVADRQLIQEQGQQIEEQEATIATQQGTITAQEALIADLRARLEGETEIEQVFSDPAVIADYQAAAAALDA